MELDTLVDVRGGELFAWDQIGQVMTGCGPECAKVSMEAKVMVHQILNECIGLITGVAEEAQLRRDCARKRILPANINEALMILGLDRFLMISFTVPISGLPALN